MSIGKTEAEWFTDNILCFGDYNGPINTYLQVIEQKEIERHTHTHTQHKHAIL